MSHPPTTIDVYHLMDECPGCHYAPEHCRCAEYVTCPRCDGQGHSYQHPLRFGDEPGGWEACGLCEGEGSILPELVKAGPVYVPSMAGRADWTADEIAERCDELMIDVFRRCSPETTALLNAAGIYSPERPF